MSFEAIDPQPAPREEKMLAGDRAPNVDSPYSQRAPGLYPGELALRLEDGTLVAVSVDQPRAENGAGFAFHGCARWIEADGSTHLCRQGMHVEANLTVNPSAVDFDAYGAAAIARDVMLILLGEAPELMRDVPVEGGEPIRHPVIALDAESLLNANVRKAIEWAGATPAQADLAALLAPARADGFDVAASG